jgi:hypothetical protein
MVVMSKQSKVEYMVRVDQAVSEGKLWKAKEILQGNIAATRFDPALYEKYATVLLEMGDLVEAGKYIFLAGNNKPEYIHAKELYLSRYAKSGWQNLYGTFPSWAKLLDLSEYPESVADELRRLGYPEEERRKLKAAQVVAKPKTFKERLLAVLAIAFGLFIVLCLFVGAVVVISTIIGWVF